MDALSAVLNTIRLSGSLFFRAELGAPYAVSSLTNAELGRAFGGDADHILPFHLVTAGATWFVVADEPPVKLDEGDLIVLPRGNDHQLMDELGRPPIPVGELQEERHGRMGTLMHGGPTPTCTLLCGFFRLNGKSFNPLLDALPTVLVVRRNDERSLWLSATLERAFFEDIEARPGADALVDRLTELLFIDVVQAHLRQHRDDHGWLAGLKDPIVGRALGLIHGQPGQPWTVEALAAKSGASRSALAERFRAMIGQSVMRYLTAWRMELAAERLLASELSVAQIAAEVGYESEASLNRAFKRHVGEPPAAWRRAKRAR